jgi:hypothetical protein
MRRLGVLTGVCPMGLIENSLDASALPSSTLSHDHIPIMPLYARSKNVWTDGDVTATQAARLVA